VDETALVGYETLLQQYRWIELDVCNGRGIHGKWYFARWLCLFLEDAQTSWLR